MNFFFRDSDDVRSKSDFSRISHVDIFNNQQKAIILTMLSSCKAIIFDLGGVVLNLDFDATVHAFRKLGGERFQELYNKSYQDGIFDQFETGQVNAASFRKYMMQFLPDGTSDDQIDQAWNAMLLDLPAERIAMIRRLGKSHRIFLLSNTNEIHLHRFRHKMADRYGDEFLMERIFERTYYSHLLKMRKPHPEAFTHVLNENLLQPGETLFIDDSVQHIEGARKAGLQTHHLDRGSIVDIFG